MMLPAVGNGEESPCLRRGVDSSRRRSIQRVMVLTLSVAAMTLIAVPLSITSSSARTVLENGVSFLFCFWWFAVPFPDDSPPQIDAQMSSDVTKIMSNPTQKDETPQTDETRVARAVKGDLMMERDLIKHMKMVRSQIVNGTVPSHANCDRRARLARHSLRLVFATFSCRIQPVPALTLSSRVFALARGADGDQGRGIADQVFEGRP